jgi:molecular chaperone GrpE (heat shock protein)
MNVGDFVKHTRQGPGRITQVCADYIEVKPSNGHVFKVNNALAKHELTPVPPDGFTALLATRQPTSDYLLHNIADVTRRILIDRRGSSVTAKDLRAELQLFIKREGKSFPGWWKKSRTRLLDSGIFKLDSKRKGVFVLSDETYSSPALDWDKEASQTTDLSALLDFARRISAADPADQAVNHVAQTVLERVVRAGQNGDSSPRTQLERMLILCYLGSRVTGDAKDQLVRSLEEIDVSSISLERDLDDDVAIGLSNLSKLSVRKAAEWSATLLNHPSATVSKRAFTILNTDRLRFSLKERLLGWIESANIPPLPNLDLYLDVSFLTHIRKEDKAALYSRLTPHAGYSHAVTAFLNEPETIRIVASIHRSDSQLAHLQVPTAGLGREGLSLLISQLGPDKVLKTIVQDFQPQYEAVLPEAIRSADWNTLADLAPQLRNLLASNPNEEALGAILRRLTIVMQESHGVELLKATTIACDYNSLCSVEGSFSLGNSIQTAFTKLLTDTDTNLRPLSAAVQLEATEVKHQQNALLQTTKNELKHTTARLEASEVELTRLRSTVQVIKATATEQIESTRRQTLRGFITLLLPMIDEVERRSQTGDNAATNLRDDFISALEQIGVVEVGVSNTVQVFDPHMHELLQESNSAIGTVVIARPGFMLRDGDAMVLLRRALVRPVEEEDIDTPRN